MPIFYIRIGGRVGKHVRHNRHHADVWQEGPARRIGPEPGVADGYRFMPRPGDYTLLVQCKGYAPYIETVTLPRTPTDRASLQQPERIVRLNPQ